MLGFIDIFYNINNNKVSVHLHSGYTGTARTPSLILQTPTLLDVHIGYITQQGLPQHFSTQVSTPRVYLHINRSNRSLEQTRTAMTSRSSDAQDVSSSTRATSVTCYTGAYSSDCFVGAVPESGVTGHLESCCITYTVYFIALHATHCLSTTSADIKHLNYNCIICSHHYCSTFISEYVYITY